MRQRASTSQVGAAGAGRSQRRGRSAWACLLVLGLLLGIGWLASAQIEVTVTIEDTAGTHCSGGTGICPEPSAVGESYWVEFEVRVTGSNPSSLTPYGTVTVDDGEGNTCSRTLDSGSYPNGWAWDCQLTSTSVGVKTITATFVPSDSNFAGASDTEEHTVVPETGVTVFVSDTPLVVGDTATGYVSVYGIPNNLDGPPTGTISLSTDGNGDLSPTSYSLGATDNGYFEFTYTPNDAATTPHTITATYAGDTLYGGGNDTFEQEIIKRQADITMTVSPTTAYIHQDVEITVCVLDDTTAGEPGTLSGETVTLTTDGTGVFEGSDPTTHDATLDANGCCTVTYTPGPFEAGVTTLAATFGTLSDVYEGCSTSELLTVELRPTQTTITGSSDTLLVNQGYGYSVTVEDIADAGTATSPLGFLYYSSYLGGDASLSPTGGVAPTGSFTYTCLGLDAEAGIDTVYADYDPVDGTHAASSGLFGQGLQRRPTVTSVSGTSTPDGVNYVVTVTEDAGNEGTPAILFGDIHLLEPDETPCAGLVGLSLLCSSSIDSTSPLVNVTVKYEPSDRTHLASTDSENIDRSDQFDPNQGGDGTTGENCNDGCGTGGVDIAQMIYDLNAADVALAAVQMGLEVAAIAVDLIPDGVVTGGLVVQTGVTIPYSDIAAAIIAGSGIAIEIARTAMTTDLDGDGLPDVVENTVTGTSQSEWDTDGDGMGDLDEIEEAGGYYGGSRRPDPNNPDSDGDGLTDGDEAGLYNTSFCVADTDCDTVTDGTEVATWDLAEIRDHADPLMQDTDGDGLRDDLEIAAGCPYVNDDDSDDDGLQDGYEDSDRNGIFDPGTIGGTGTTGDGETNFCDADTDGDGLLDGLEEGLLGQGLVSAVTASGTVMTEPALDTDSDDDGLSDGEEVNVTQTDPFDWDTDDDGLSDSNELMAVSGTWPSRSFVQISDPLDPDTDDDGLTDDVEYDGTGLGTSHELGGEGDNECPYVNDDDSDDDGLQDGAESWNGDATITTGTIGDTSTQSDINPSGETDFCDPDTDGDGLTDGEEVALLGGLPIDPVNGFTSVTPKGVSPSIGVEGNPLTATVPPLDDDSDNDGLSDYEEINITHTDPLDQDTDNDTLSDADELIATGGSWPNRSFFQVSDPLDPDTDDDGLTDNVEYAGSGLGTSRSSTGGVDDLDCPYVNNDDSDADGLQDGVEDANHNGVWDGVTLGSYDTQSVLTGTHWETDPCNPDTDGDGLLDGEEVNLLGGGPILGRPADWPAQQPVPGFDTVTPEGVSTTLPVADYSGTGPLYTFIPTAGLPLGVTVPALDMDSDNDGLSDYEEVNVTGTDPLDADTDNDTLSDANELVSTGGSWPRRSFDQESDPLDINTDDDYLFDPVEGSCADPIYAGTGLTALSPGVRDLECPYVNNADSDSDSIEDGAVIPISAQGPGMLYAYVFIEGFLDVEAADIQAPGTVRTVVTPATGEQNDDLLCNVCDSDSDGDGLNDGEEVGIATDPQDWDTDDDGRNDWHEQTGGGPIPTDPFDPDTDDDGLLDSAEVFGSNPTNPVVADTDGDGLCDGGAGTPYMTSAHPTVTVNPICKTCSTPGLIDCGTGSTRAGSLSGIGDHPNRLGLGEDQNGNGAWDSGETDPNQYDTDGDAIADGIERLAYSTSRQSMIPAVDLFGRPILVTYPEANNVLTDCGCLDPLNSDTDGDGLSDGYEDANQDGNFDFLSSEFDSPNSEPDPDPAETNPCEADTDHDGLTDYEEWIQRQPLAFHPDTPYDDDGDGQYDEDWIDGIDNDYDGLIDEDPPVEVELPFNPTNPLDHDTDNDYILDGPEVYWVCVPTYCSQLDNDSDARINEDPIDGLDNDNDGLIDEDPVDFVVRQLAMLDPTNRDSDADGYLDGLDEDPCNSECLPVYVEVEALGDDTDDDGFTNEDEIFAGTHPNDPEDYPAAYGLADLDFDTCIDDQLWLEPAACCGLANSVAIDIDDDYLVDLRVQIIQTRNVQQGDFDKDGFEDDTRYTVEFALSNYRVNQPRVVVTIDDYDTDLIIDWVVVVQK